MDSRYDKTIRDRQDGDKKKLVAALKEVPNVQAACKRSNVSRDTYYRWRREDRDFRKRSDEAVGQGIEFLNDMSEAQLVALIKAGKMPAISMWLKHNHPRYGGRAARGPAAADIELTAEEKRLFDELINPGTNDHDE